jgi:hypothetical protein
MFLKSETREKARERVGERESVKEREGERD